MVKLLGLDDAWRSFLDFSPSYIVLRDSKSATTPRPQATEKTHPYMSGQPLPAGGFQELGASNDLNLTLKDMTLNDLILKEFGLKLKRKIDVFSKVVACADAT